MLSALIQNFDTVEKAIETSANSAGSALKENERYLDSIQGKIDQFNNALQSMWSSTLDSDIVKWFVGLGAELIKIVDTIGLIPSILTAILTYKLAIGAIKMFDLTGLGTYIGMLFTANSATEVQGLLINKTALAQKLLNSTLIQAQAARMGLTAADLAGYSVTQLLALGVKGLAAGFKNLWIAMGPVGWAIIGITVALTAGIAIFNAVHKTTEELAEELSDLKSEMQDLESEIDTLNSELETAQERMAELIAMPSLSFVEQEELATLKQTTAELERQLKLKQLLADSKEDAITLASEKYIDRVWNSKNADKTYAINQGVIKEDGFWDMGINTKDALSQAMAAYEKSNDVYNSMSDALANWDELNDYDKYALTVKAKPDVAGDLVEEENWVKAAHFNQIASKKDIEKYLQDAKDNMTNIAEGINMVFSDENFDDLEYGMSEDIDAFLDEIYAYQLKWQQTQGAYVKSDAISSMFDATSTKEMQAFGKALQEIADSDLTDEEKNATILKQLDSIDGAIGDGVNKIDGTTDAYNRLHLAMETVGVTAQDIADYFILETGAFDLNTVKGVTNQYQHMAGVMDTLKNMSNNKFTFDNIEYNWDEFFSKDDQGKFEANAVKFSEILKGIDNDSRETFVNIVESAANSAGDLSKIDWNQAIAKLDFSGLDRTFELLNNEFEGLNNEMFAGAADDIHGLIDTVSELQAALEDVASTMDLVHTAQTQMNGSGRVSVKTALELMQTTEDWESILEITNGTIKLRDGAEQHLIQTELTAIKTQLHYAWTTAQARYETALAAQGELDYANNSGVVMTAESIKAEAIGRVSAVVVALGAAMDKLMAREWGSVFSAFGDTYRDATATVVQDAKQYATDLATLKKSADDSKKMYDAFSGIDTAQEFKNNYDFDKTPGDKYNEGKDDAFQKEMDYWENRIKANQAKYEQVQNEIDLLEAKGKRAGAAYYNEQIKLEKDRLNLLNQQQDQAELRLKALEAAGKKGSEEWWEVAHTFNDIENEIDGVTLSIQELNNAIIEGSHGFVDDIQSAYDTLTESHKEYVENGYLSVDTLQSLLELEPKYLDLLVDENGNLSLNEKVLQDIAKARIKDLAIKQQSAILENALALATDGSKQAIIEQIAVMETANAVGEDWISVQMRGIIAAINARVAAGELTATEGEEFIYRTLSQIEAVKTVTESSLADISKSLSGPDEDDTFQKQIDYWENRIQANQSKYEQIQNEIDLLEAKGKRAGSSYYQEQIALENQRKGLLEKQRDASIEYLGTLEAGSEEWWETAHAINDIESELDGVDLSIQELKNKIIDEAHGFVDDIQNVYDTLTEAQKEYAENGYLSVDTMQQLLELEPKYLDLLVDENGNLSLNQQALQDVARARIEDLVIKQQSAILDNALALATNGSTQAIIDQIAVMEYATKVGDNFVATQMAQIKAMLAQRVAAGELSQEYADAFISGVESQIAAVQAVAQSSLSDLDQSLSSSSSSDDEEDAFQREMDYWENRIRANRAKYEQIQNDIDLLESKGKKADAAYYEEQIKLEEDRKGLLEQQKAAALAHIATLQEGSDEWWEAAHILNDIEGELDDVTAAIVSLQDAIGEIDAYKFEEFNKRLDNLTNKLSTIRDLIAPNGSEDWFDDQGNWTEDGVAVLGTYIQELETYKNGLAEVNAERKKYEDAYAGNEEYYEKLGIHSEQEYYDKVQEIIEQQYDYTKLISDTEQSVVDMYESQIDAVEEYTQTLVESYNDYIDSVKEALDAERDLYDFKKNVKKQSKDIAAIERRIASLSGSTNASDIAERRKLEADLYDARESLNDTYYDHAQSAQDEALEKEAAAYEETMTRFVDGLHTSLDQATTDMEAFLAGVTTTVMYNADTVLAKYQETNLPLTTELTNPWIKAKDAVGAYDKDALDLMNEWTKEDGYFAQFNATGTENLESPWGAGTNAASAFKTDVAGIMSQVVSDIETNVTTAGTKLSELYAEIQDTDARMSAVVVSVTGAVSNISSQVGAASKEIDDFYSQIQDYEDKYGDGGNSGGDTGSSLTSTVGAPTSNPSGSGSQIKDTDSQYYEDPDANKLIWDPYQNPYKITETAAEKRENARIAAQAYVDKKGFSEGDKARWGQDPNFLPLLQALIKAGGSINDLKGKVYTYKTSGTLPSGQYSVSGLNAISWGADDFTVKMGGKSYDVATGDPATVGQESDLIKLCGTNPATGTLAMVNKSLFVRHKNGRWRIVGTKNDGRALTSEFYSKLNAYAKGTTGTPDDQFAIVDEFGPELIMHANPTTGRLEYLTKGSGVIPADMTKNLMEWSQFTPDAMNLGSGVNVNMINNAVNKPEFNLNVDNFLRCDNVSQDSLPELKQFVKTEMNNLIKQMNYSLKSKGAR